MPRSYGRQEIQRERTPELTLKELMSKFFSSSVRFIFGLRSPQDVVNIALEEFRLVQTEATFSKSIL